MEKKRILKGLLRLTIALVVTCGVGLSLFGTEVKAAASTTDFASDGTGQAKVDIVQGTPAVVKVVFEIGGESVYTAVPSKTDEGWTESLKLSKETIIQKLEKTMITGGNQGVITAKVYLDGSATPTTLDTPTVKTDSIYKITAPSTKPEHVTELKVGSVDSDEKAKIIDGVAYAYSGAKVTYTVSYETGYTATAWTATNGSAVENGVLTVGTKDDEAKPTVAAVPKIVVKDSDGNEVTTSVSLKPSTADSIFTASGCDGYTYLWEKVEDATNMGSTTTTNPEKLNISHIKAGTCKWKISATKAGAPTPEPITITFTCADPVIDHISLFVGGTEYKTSTSTITIAPKADVECTIKAFDDKGNDVTSSFSFAVSTSNTSFKITPSGSTFKINGAGGGLTATVAVTASKDSTDKKSNTFTFTTSGFGAVISPSSVSIEPGDSTTLTGSITPAPATGETVTYKWEIYQEGKATAVKTGSGATIKYNFPKETTYTVTLTATKGGVSESTSITVTPVWEPYIDIVPTTVILSTGETALLTASSAEMFVDADKSDFDLTFENNKNNIDEANSKVTSVAKNGKTCVVQIKAGSEPTTSSQGLVFNLGYDGVDSNDVKLHVYKKPSVSKTVNSGSDQYVTFSLPGYVGTSRTANMTVTGYRVNIFKDNNCVKTSEVKSASAGDRTIKISEIINDVASVASGDSYTFKVGIQPVGKVNNTGDVVDAKTVDSSGNEIDYVSDLSGEFTVYRLNLTADAGITVSPAATWGVEKQTTDIKATGVVGYWTRNGVKIEGTDGKQSYTHTFSSTTADNRIGAVLGASVPGAAGGAAGGATAGLDDVPKTAESNAPIWLIIVLVFAAMGGGYALYMQMKPVKVKNAPKTPFVNGDDDYDDNF